MKNLDLNALGVMEMSEREKQISNGGIGVLALIVIGLAIAAGAEIFGDWDEFKLGLSGQA